MIEQDTIRLLRECDAGIEMGTSSIRDVLTRTQAPGLRLALTNCMAAHEKLKYELNDLLSQYHDGGKSPKKLKRKALSCFHRKNAAFTEKICCWRSSASSAFRTF